MYEATVERTPFFGSAAVDLCETARIPALWSPSFSSPYRVKKGYLAFSGTIQMLRNLIKAP